MSFQVSSNTTNRTVLLEAIRKLDELSTPEKNKSPVSIVSRVKSLVRTFLGQEERDEEVKRVIDIISRFRFHIHVWAKGNLEEQKFAHLCTDVINRYNEYNDQHNKGRGWPKIDLLRPWTVKRYYYSDPKQEGYVSAISPIQQAAAMALMPKTVNDLFRMKGLALLEQFHIASNPEARATVIQSPIMAIEHDETKCTLQQRLHLFPGQTVVVTGKAAFDGKTNTVGLPDPKTFFVFLESTQTGFPHPIQRSGWALASQLLPEYPQRIDLLELTVPVFDAKRKIATDLLSDHEFIRKAKRLAQLKQQVFHRHRQELLMRHRDLAYVLVAASPQANLPDGIEGVIEGFYNFVKNEPNPFDVLVKVSEEINQQFVMQPHQVALKAIVHGKSTDLGSDHAVDRACAMQKILSQAFENAIHDVWQKKSMAHSEEQKKTLDYISCLGAIIASAAKSIILQYLSEDLIFYPPKLTLFQQKIQEAAYRQVRDFFDELSLSHLSETVVYQNCINQYQQDLAIFQQGKNLMLAHELASYFQNRYASLITVP